MPREIRILIDDQEPVATIQQAPVQATSGREEKPAKKKSDGFLLGLLLGAGAVGFFVLCQLSSDEIHIKGQCPKQAPGPLVAPGPPPVNVPGGPMPQGQIPSPAPTPSRGPDSTLGEEGPKKPIPPGDVPLNAVPSRKTPGGPGEPPPVNAAGGPTRSRGSEPNLSPDVPQTAPPVSRPTFPRERLIDVHDAS